MKTIKLLSIIISAIAIISCGSGNVPDGWKTFKKGNYTVNYPEHWDVDTSGYGGAEFSFLTVDTTQEDLFTDNVTLGIQNLKGQGIDLQKFADLSEAQVAQMGAAGALLENTLVEKGNHPHQRFVYTVSQNGINLKVVQYYWIVNEQAYILSFTSDAAKYELYKAEGEGIMNSFEIAKD